MMTRRVFAVSLPAALAARRLRAETAEDRGRKLMDKLVQALGGDVFLNMHDRTEEGRAYSFFREQLSGLSIMHLYTQYTSEARSRRLSRRFASGRHFSKIRTMPSSSRRAQSLK